MRLMRWMMIGDRTSTPPAAMNQGLRNRDEKLDTVGGPRGRTRSHTSVQELGKNGVEIIAGAGQLIVDAQPGAAPAHLDEVLFQGLDVAVAERARIAQQRGQLLHALEAGAAHEREG